MDLIWVSLWPQLGGDPVNTRFQTVASVILVQFHSGDLPSQNISSSVAVGNWELEEKYRAVGK